MQNLPASLPDSVTTEHAKASLCACFEEFPKQGGEFLAETLSEAGWYRVGTTNLVRLRRRVTLNQLGMSFGILDPRGFRSIFNFYRHMRIPMGTRSPSFLRHIDGSLAVRTDVLRNDNWPDAKVVLARTCSEEKASSGFSIGVWAFVPRDVTLIETESLREKFNGNSSTFFTPVGNWRGLQHKWEDRGEGGSQYGRIAKSGRDPYIIEYARERFPGKLLPQLELAEIGALYRYEKSERLH